MNGLDLAVLIPLWRRTSGIEPVYRSVRETVPLARVVFIGSEQDEAVADGLEDLHWKVMADAYDACGFQTEWRPGPGGEMGDYARKINAGYRASTEPFLFTGADDVVFHEGWYDAARAVMDGINETSDAESKASARGAGYWVGDHASLVTVGVVGTVDLCNDRTMRGEHSTHSLVARWYADCCAVADHPGAIYAEVYAHEFCDDELVETAKARGAYAHAHDAVVEHLHPNVRKAPDDETYRRGRLHSRLSRRRFLARRRLWRVP